MANPEWNTLSKHADRCRCDINLLQALNERSRVDKMCLQAPHILVDFSKNLWDEAALQCLLHAAECLGVERLRDAMFAGAEVNSTEKRPVLHTHLRASEHSDHKLFMHVQAGLRNMLLFADQVRAEKRFTDVVHIGIGGSSLGPELALQALHPWYAEGPRVHIVSNMDGHDLQQTLAGLNRSTTLFVVASKSWTTAETQRNMASSKAWLSENNSLRWPEHFAAVTSREELACAAGFVHVFHIPEGVGGRFSIWSAVGLPVALAVGVKVFQQMLAGAAEMDAHFANTPLQSNVPVWLGLLDVWYFSLMQFPARCVAPYHHGLRRLPAYLQQLEMESNGKCVNRAGESLPHVSTGIVWGEAGSNSQHAFFQWLHQGTSTVPVEFIVARKASHGLCGHQQALVANALAQAQALMQGAKARPDQLQGHQDFLGNKPSTFMLLDALTPESLGALLALHEHRVLVAGAVWGINSFDQWGVELGKVLATDLERRLDDGDCAGLDTSTAGLLVHCVGHITV